LNILGFDMEAEKFDKRKKTKKPKSNLESNIETNFSLIIQHTLKSKKMELTLKPLYGVLRTRLKKSKPLRKEIAIY